MCLLKLINFLVFLMLTTNLANCDIVTYQRPSKHPLQSFDIFENDTLHMTVIELDYGSGTIESCTGSCHVEKHKLNLSCKSGEDQHQKVYLNATINNPLTKEHSGKWNCSFSITTRISVNETGQQRISTVFKLAVKGTGCFEMWPCYIYVGVGILVGVVLVIIMVQTYCIIHFRKKAKAVRREAQWSNRNKDSTEDGSKTELGPRHMFRLSTRHLQELLTRRKLSRKTYLLLVLARQLSTSQQLLKMPRGEAKHMSRSKFWQGKMRYSKMPGLKKKEVLIPESRESGIYEALENVRVAPVPPPVESLPRKQAVPKTPPVPADPPTPTPPGTSIFSSLLRRKNKKAEEAGLVPESATSTLDKRTTLDRIKERPQFPIPTEEDVYEAMETPPPTRKEIKKPAAVQKTAPKEDLRAFALPKPKPAVQPAANIGNVAVPLNLQLKQAVEKKTRLNPVLAAPPPKPKTLATPKETLRPTTTLQPPMPKLKPWQKEATVPKENVRSESTLPKAKVWPKEPMAPKEKVWQKEPMAPKQKVWQKEPPPQPQEQEAPQRPIGSLRPKVAAFNPGLPPPDAPAAKIRTPWGEAVPPKPRPPPPVKPKQLHPLPQPPCEPEPPEPEHDDPEPTRDSDDSDSEWMYEPLPQYNIYSN